MKKDKKQILSELENNRIKKKLNKEFEILSNFKIKDFIKIWKERNLKINEILQDYTDLLSKIEESTIKNQIKLEKSLKKKKEIEVFSLMCMSNNLIKKYFLEMVNTLGDKLKFNLQLKKRYLNKFVFSFFKSLVYCMKNNNYYLGTFISQLQNILYDIIKSYKDFEDKDKINKIIVKVRNILFDESLKLKLIKASVEVIEILKNNNDCSHIPKEFLKNSKIRKLTIIRLDDEISKYLESYMQYISFKPPMIVKPKAWKIKKKGSKYEYYEGGYYHNLFLSVSIDKFKRVIFRKKYFDAINYMQKIPLTINIDYLEYILNSNVLLIKDEYPNFTYEDLLNYKEEKFENIRTDKTCIINEICFMLYLADIYKNKKFYFPCIHDWRGRTYPNTFPLTYYIKDVWKGLFSYNIRSTLDNFSRFTFIKNNTRNEELFKINYKEFMNYNFQSLESEKNKYSFISIIYAKDLAMIGLDASSSCFQIQGLLINDLEMLKYTNVFANNEKLDIYMYIAEKFAIKFKSNIKNFNFKSFNYREKYKEADEKKELWELINLTNISKDLLGNEVELKIIKNEKHFMNFINDILKDRSLIKQIILRLGYNQQIDSRQIETWNFIKEHYLKDLTYNNYYFNRFLWNFCYEIEQTFFELFPKQDLLRKFILKCISLLTKEWKLKKENCTINFSLPITDSHIVNQTYIKYNIESVQIRSRTYNKKFHLKFAIPNEEEKLDVMKTRTSTLPNYIQYLDSCIMIEFLILAKKEKNMPIKTIHDNFLTNWDNYNKLNALYIKAMQNVILRKPHPLYHFLEVNNLLTPELLKLYNNLTDNNIDINNFDKIDKLNYQKLEEDYAFIKKNMHGNKYILSF